MVWIRKGIIRAAVANLASGGRIQQGASTITQQVAKNFLLSSEQTIDRKIREALIAFRMESAFSKDTILELYLNEIFLGTADAGAQSARGRCRSAGLFRQVGT